MGAFKVQVDIGDPEGRNFQRIEVLANTGAFFTTISPYVMIGLGVDPQRTQTFELADGTTKQFDTADVRVRMNGREVTTLVVIGKEGCTPLLGVYTLTGLGMSVDSTGSRLVELIGRL